MLPELCPLVVLYNYTLNNRDVACHDCSVSDLPPGNTQTKSPDSCLVTHSAIKSHKPLLLTTENLTKRDIIPELIKTWKEILNCNISACQKSYHKFLAFASQASIERYAVYISMDVVTRQIILLVKCIKTSRDITSNRKNAGNVARASPFLDKCVTP